MAVACLEGLFLARPRAEGSLGDLTGYPGQKGGQGHTCAAPGVCPGPGALAEGSLFLFLLPKEFWVRGAAETRKG